MTINSTLENKKFGEGENVVGTYRRAVSETIIQPSSDGKKSPSSISEAGSDSTEEMEAQLKKVAGSIDFSYLLKDTATNVSMENIQEIEKKKGVS